MFVSPDRALASNSRSKRYEFVPLLLETCDLTAKLSDLVAQCRSIARHRLSVQLSVEIVDVFGAASATRNKPLDASVLTTVVACAESEAHQYHSLSGVGMPRRSRCRC